MSTHNDIALFKLPDGEYVTVPARLAHANQAESATVTGVVRGISYQRGLGVRSVHRAYIVQLDEPADSGYSSITVEAQDVSLLDSEDNDG